MSAHTSAPPLSRGLRDVATPHTTRAMAHSSTDRLCPEPSRECLLVERGGRMLTREENELLCRVGPETPMGQMLRRYWLPALLSSEPPEPDGAPKRVRLLGQDLGVFRDSHGQVGLLDEKPASPPPLSGAIFPG